MSQSLPVLSQKYLQTIQTNSKEASKKTPKNLALPVSAPISTDTPKDVQAEQPIWLHIGAGAFHRAHQALCMDRIHRAVHHAETATAVPTNSKSSHSPQSSSSKESYPQSSQWRLLATTLRRADDSLIKNLSAQDHLYTLIETSEGAPPSFRVMGVHEAFFSAAREFGRFINLLANPKCELVTCTVTEGGYYLIEGEGTLDHNHSEIKHDIDLIETSLSAIASPTSNGNGSIISNIIANEETPVTLYGALLLGLFARYRAGGEPITILSCDNVIGNGNVLRAGLLGFAEATHAEPGFIQWIKETVATPNSMVDRITPAMQPAHSDLIKQELGYHDAAPILAETFWQWVIEDNFAARRPPFELGGAEFVDDVQPYEELKLRILNAGHVSLAYRGMLLGLTTYDEVLRDSEQRKFYDAYQREESLPQLQHLAALNPEKYLAVATQRFGNRALADTLLRIGCDGMSKVPKFILPTLKANLEKNGSVQYAAEILVNWASAVGAHFDGKMPQYMDGEIETLRQWVEADGLKQGLLLNAALWGEAVVTHPRYQEAITRSLEHGLTTPREA